MVSSTCARLLELGFDDFFDAALAALGHEDWEAARVVSDRGSLIELASTSGVNMGRLSPTLIGAAVRPVVGDWVSVRRLGARTSVVEGILPRRTAVRRRATADSGTVGQVLAANVDVVFAVLGLDRDFNLRRLERLLALAWSSGAQPAVLLTKADLNAQPQAAVAAVRELAGDVPVLVTSAVLRAGLEEVQELVEPGRTAVLLGSSGIGKSSLINAMLESDALEVGSVRDRDGRGRHITTTRELVGIPGAGMIIDTPGLREVQLWLDDESVDLLFADLHELAARCRFSNCRHQIEPGCAVRAALNSGTLARARWHAFLKLRGELASTRDSLRDRQRHQAMLRKRKFVAAARDVESWGS